MLKFILVWQLVKCIKPRKKSLVGSTLGALLTTRHFCRSLPNGFHYLIIFQMCFIYIVSTISSLSCFMHALTRKLCLWPNVLTFLELLSYFLSYFWVHASLLNLKPQKAMIGAFSYQTQSLGHPQTNHIFLDAVLDPAVPLYGLHFVSCPAFFIISVPAVRNQLRELPTIWSDLFIYGNKTVPV